VWGEAELAEHGMGGLLAVGAGSARPPRLVRLDYRPADATRTVALVGKGITFDSGGLSLKPPESMIPMKTDMSGAAAVLATMVALPALAVPVAVTGFMAIAENMPGAAANRPDDVIVHHGGRTTEVRNTDAEGRLVLADVLALAAGQLKPDVMVDLATLTGAATMGLGRGHAALYTTSQQLAAGLTAASERSGEHIWQMPLHWDYQDRIASEVADAANSDTASGIGPGSITAALFLAPFAGDTPWAHLDIAGPARSDADRDELPKGATGFGARLLLQWLAAGAPS
jgi:leucyl aminopeptidase